MTKTGRFFLAAALQHLTQHTLNPPHNTLTFQTCLSETLTSDLMSWCRGFWGSVSNSVSFMELSYIKLSFPLTTMITLVQEIQSAPSFEQLNLKYALYINTCSAGSDTFLLPFIINIRILAKVIL